MEFSNELPPFTMLIFAEINISCIPAKMQSDKEGRRTRHSQKMNAEHSDFFILDEHNFLSVTVKIHNIRLKKY
jgi:hypothetical protein